jgi:hypothetical protein
METGKAPMNPKVEELARDLAAVTGETVEEAVESALRQRLAEERRRRNRLELINLAKRIIRESGPPGSTDAADRTGSLYDEKGLPV